MALESKKGELDSKIIDFNLPGIDDRHHSLKEYVDANVLVIIFMCNHCPYVKGVAGRFTEFQKNFEGKGVRLIGINSNDTVSYPEDSFENMKLFAKEYNLNFPYLFDETQSIAKQYDAVCTPDIYVYNKERKLKYRGRLDDNWKDVNAVREKDLEKAVNLILQGKDIEFSQIPSMGCSIKWK